MPFKSGRVTFTRFLITGDAPASVDETTLGLLKEHAFREVEIGAPDEIEAGFTTGEHLFDTQFTFEKNGFGIGGSILHFALRIDTHKVPSEVKQAYQQINEQAAAAASPTGFASKAEKREAKESAADQMREDLAAGKYRKSKLIPLLWDLPNQTLYCGATGNTVHEQLSRLLRDAFAVDVQLVSSGVLAGEYFRSHGKQRDYEDLRPSPFTAPPPEASAQADDADFDADKPQDLSTPMIPWVAQSVDLKDFLGNEFAIWLWYSLENKETEGVLTVDIQDSKQTRQVEISYAIDKALDMDCAWDCRGKQTLRGDIPHQLPEAREALATGKWPRKLGLMLSDGEHHYELTLQADRFITSAAKLPDIDDAQHPRELIEARFDHTLNLTQLTDGLYQHFLKTRTGSNWSGLRQSMNQWIKNKKS